MADRRRRDGDEEPSGERRERGSRDGRSSGGRPSGGRPSGDGQRRDRPSGNRRPGDRAYRDRGADRRPPGRRGDTPRDGGYRDERSERGYRDDRGDRGGYGDRSRDGGYRDDRRDRGGYRERSRDGDNAERSGYRDRPRDGGYGDRGYGDRGYGDRGYGDRNRGFDRDRDRGFDRAGGEYRDRTDRPRPQRDRPPGDRPPGERPWRGRDDRDGYRDRPRRADDGRGGFGFRRPTDVDRPDRDRWERRDDRAGLRPRQDRSGPPPWERRGGAGADERPRPWERRPRPSLDRDGGAVYEEELVEQDAELIAGRHPVEEAFAAGRPARRLLVVPQRRAALESLVRHATTLRIPVVEVEGGSLTSIAGFDGHQGIALVTDARTWGTIDDVLAKAAAPGEAAFVLVLDSLEDPQNMGTLLRAAEAAGVHGVLFPTRRAAPLTPAAVKASAGAVEHLVLVPVEDLPGALADLHLRGLRIVGAEAEAALGHRDADLRGPLALVVGSEGHGLGAAVRRRLDLSVRIPMRGRVGSLNAAVAGSILLFEAAGQRDLPAREPIADAMAQEPTVAGDGTALTAAEAAEGAERVEADAPDVGSAEPSGEEGPPTAARRRTATRRPKPALLEPPTEEAHPEPRSEGAGAEATAGDAPKPARRRASTRRPTSPKPDTSGDETPELLPGEPAPDSPD